jgi:RNase H-like domain found in reverse transcriptase/Integrase zinc binding domain
LILACDSSGKGIGGVLFQDHLTEEDIEQEIVENTIFQNGNRKIVNIFSKKLNFAQSWYSTIESELLAVISLLTHSRHLIKNSQKPLIILTDHRNLRTWEKFKIVRHRHFNWLEVMTEFNMRIRFIPGYANSIADSLSRICVQSGNNKRPKPYLRDTIGINAIREKENNENIKLTTKGIKELHTKYIHPGETKMGMTVKREIAEPVKKKMIAKIVKYCDICQRIKHLRGKRRGLIGSDEHATHRKLI